KGEKVGVMAVRLYRPFSVEHFIGALPKSVKSIAVLDRTKEPGAIGDPLYLDVIAALREAEDLEQLPFAMPRVVGGRYGLSSKEFSPAMVKAVFDELTAKKPRRRFTVGIVDDVTHRSLEYDPEFDIEPDDVVRAVFFGLGADGTVGANKNSIKIIGEETDFYVQGYFVYDSKKSGAMTISHLRFGPRPIRSTYLIRNAGFVACHQFHFLERMNVLDYARPGAVFLLNSPHAPGEVWDKLPLEAQEQLIEKKVKLFVIDGSSVAIKTGMGGRVNTIMQTCFFALSGVLPREEAIAKIKKSIEKSYAKKGDEVVRRNWAAVDATLENLHEVKLPSKPTSKREPTPMVPANAPDFVQRITAVMMSGKGDLLPVSAFAPDGTWPTATAQWERRNIAIEIPIWDPEFCIQCNKCAFVCPHAAIRAKVYDKGGLSGAPDAFQKMDYKGNDYKGMSYTIQVAPEDCTGCNLCVNVCPGKDKTNPKHKAINMLPHLEHAPIERPNFAFFLDLPELDRTALPRLDVKGTQFLQPLFEFSGACAGCGETPYIKLLTQLYG
ncbi:MAG: 2-oxoacid:acceptor oxidoreductase family protein, partial [Thermoanaerobaculia bacterium]